MTSLALITVESPQQQRDDTHKRFPLALPKFSTVDGVFIIDYNGEGHWSAAEILARYAQYAAEAQITARDLSPREYTSGARKWIRPVMDKVIEGIKAGDPACIRIGIEFIEEDQGFCFGLILKSNTARALRRAPLSREQKDRILQRIFDMLRRGYVPREIRDYVRIARTVGFSADDVPQVDERVEYLARWRRFLLAAASKGA